MEEILASIRRIISDDGEEQGNTTVRAALPPGPAPSAPSVPAAAATEEVLELTKVVADDGSVVDLAEARVASPEPEPPVIEEPRMAPPPPPVPPPAPPAMPPAPPATPQGAAEGPGLVSPPTAFAAATAFSDLTGALSTTRGWPLGNGQRTVEELVKELLRPMLKEWLDANLPALVQRVVEREVAKLAGRAEETRGS